MSIFSKRLKQLRTERKISQEELGTLFNLSKSTISLYESGKREPDYNTLTKLADYFKVTTDFLLGRIDEPTIPEFKPQKPSNKEYVLAAKTLADATMRIADLFNNDNIDETEFLRLSKLAYRKYGLPPVPSAEPAAHLEHNIPGTGVFEGDDNDEDKPRSTKKLSQQLRYKGRL